MDILQQRAQAAVKQHGGVGRAARALNINVTVLSLLASGQRTSASPKTIRALGLKARPKYEAVSSDPAPTPSVASDIT